VLQKKLHPSRNDNRDHFSAVIRNCFKADPEYEERVAKALGLTMKEINSFDMTPYDNGRAEAY